MSHGSAIHRYSLPDLKGPEDVEDEIATYLRGIWHAPSSPSLTKTFSSSHMHYISYDPLSDEVDITKFLCTCDICGKVLTFFVEDANRKSMQEVLEERESRFAWIRTWRRVSGITVYGDACPDCAGSGRLEAENIHHMFMAADELTGTVLTGGIPDVSGEM